MMVLEGRQYCWYGDSRYNEGVYLHVPFTGSNLAAFKWQFDTGMCKTRVIMEWFFKEVTLY